jgi:HD superfamily phosphodiesterase
MGGRNVADWRPLCASSGPKTFDKKRRASGRRRFLERANMINEVLKRMIQYNQNDIKRINHAMKVFGYAQYIGIQEKCDFEKQMVIEYSAILHDIGIHKAEEKYKSSAGEYQEIEGPPIANEIMNGLGIDDSIKERVLYIIGSHHSYGKVDGIDFQIIVEADFIVNIYEDAMTKDQIEAIKRNIFKTKTGISIMESMYLS